MDSKALTKIQSIILIAVIVVVGVSGITYIILSGDEQTSEPIKIGFLADLDGEVGRDTLQEAILAVEQLNAEGGILGREIELYSEDSAILGQVDLLETVSALTRLITFHEVDFIFGSTLDDQQILVCQETIAQHKKIMFYPGGNDECTQRVLDDYEKYKYFFSCGFNTTAIFSGMTDSLLHLKNITGFTKIGYLAQDLELWNGVMDGLDIVLPTNGFDRVYRGTYPLDTVDFSSYFAAAEAAEVEILIPMVAFNGIPIVNEYYARQSPMVIYGGALVGAYDWDLTNGMVDDISLVDYPCITGYPLTSKTLSTREAYFDRWNEYSSCFIYDTIRFILPDAIERAGTIETNAVIEALEDTSIETSNARDFIFTESHAMMMGKNPNDPDADYAVALLFQWQDGEQIPVYPKKIMEETGATYTFPDWAGPWDNLD